MHTRRVGDVSFGRTAQSHHRARKEAARLHEGVKNAARTPSSGPVKATLRCTASIAVGMLALAAGCHTAPGQAEPLVFFPSPPGAPRIQFLTWASGAEQVEPQSDWFEDFVLGEENLGQRMIDKPYGVAARDGVVYVCDTKGLCLTRLDFKKHTYSVMGAQGPGRLRKPINIVIDQTGHKFVADPVREQIVVFGPDDQYVTAFDVPKPARPVDVAVYGNELYVLDNDESCQIVVLDRSTGKVLRSFGEPGAEPGQFRIPGSICVDAEGYLYVSDTHNWRIQKLTRDGKPVWVRGTAGYQLGQFGRPRGIRAGPDDIIYVVDGATEIVQMFGAKEGQLLMRFGGPGNAPGALSLPSTLATDATSLPYFKKYLHKDFKAEYLLFVASQYGNRLINVYAFGSFPEGYKLSDSERTTIPRLPMEEGIGPADSPQPPADDSGTAAEKPAGHP